VLKEQISKFSSVFQGGRFEFIGTALQALGDFSRKTDACVSINYAST
jgi:hypothetical protein